MQTMKRRFGGLMKRSADEADVGAVLADFKAADEMLDRLIRDLIAWRNNWEDILRLQYDAAEAMVTLYKPIETADQDDIKHQPAITPDRYMLKCMELQKLYADTRGELAQEIGMITTKLVRPAEDAKQSAKGLHKTLKYRDNKKLDYERYLQRVEHARKKDGRSVKDEANLAKVENDLTQAQIDYQTADDQVKQTFPPVTDAIVALMPYLLANQVMLQTTIVGQLYTVLDAYCRAHQLPSPAPSDAEIISTWDREFTSLRKELEEGLKLVSTGKAVRLGMSYVETDDTTHTGFGIRNKIYNRKEGKPLPEHNLTHTSIPTITGHEEEEEQAPPRPPRPGQSPSPGYGQHDGTISSVSSAGNYDPRPNKLPYPTGPPRADYNTSPSSTYHTPPGGTPTAFGLATNGQDYFAVNRVRLSNSTGHSPAQSPSIITPGSNSTFAKKKPPPPVPVKRIPSTPAPQYVVALYDFEGQNVGDLAFREGDRIRVVKKTGSTDDWWEGEIGGRTGSFPANYVQI